MQLLPLDINASVVVSVQILRDRVWQVQQLRFTAGTLLLAPALITFSLQDRTAWLQLTTLSNLTASVVVFPGHGSD